jgi:hypothetical protein
MDKEKERQISDLVERFEISLATADGQAVLIPNDWCKKMTAITAMLEEYGESESSREIEMNVAMLGEEVGSSETARVFVSLLENEELAAEKLGELGVRAAFRVHKLADYLGLESLKAAAAESIRVRITSPGVTPLQIVKELRGDDYDESVFDSEGNAKRDLVAKKLGSEFFAKHEIDEDEYVSGGKK